MDYRRYLVEFGTGADLHGMDPTKAACRAVRDAISHCCLCGMEDLLGLKEPGKVMHVQVKIGCPNHTGVDIRQVERMIPFGTPEVEVVPGGLSVKGLSVPTLGEGDTILLANAALTVLVDTSSITL